MTLLNDSKFWEWLKEKEQKEKNNQEFEQIPLYISVDLPKSEKRPEGDSSENELDYTVDSVVYQF